MKDNELTPLFGGGNGQSYKEAVTISGAEDSSTVDAEYVYITRKWGIRGADWEIVSQQLHKEEGRYYDKIFFKLADGAEKCVFFDITAYLEAMRRSINGE